MAFKDFIEIYENGKNEIVDYEEVNIAVEEYLNKTIEREKQGKLKRELRRQYKLDNSKLAIIKEIRDENPNISYEEMKRLIDIRFDEYEVYSKLLIEDRYNYEPY